MKTFKTPKVVIAGNDRQARVWCARAGVDPRDAVIVKSIRSIEGLRFYPDDVHYVGSYESRDDIEDIKEIVARTAVLMPRRENP